MLFRHADWLNPFRNRVWWQLISHKYLRIASPLFLAVALVSTTALASHSLFRVLFVAEMGLLLVAWLALVSPAAAGSRRSLGWPARALESRGPRT